MQQGRENSPLQVHKLLTRQSTEILPTTNGAVNNILQWPGSKQYFANPLDIGTQLSPLQSSQSIPPQLRRKGREWELRTHQWDALIGHQCIVQQDQLFPREAQIEAALVPF